MARAEAAENSVGKKLTETTLQGAAVHTSAIETASMKIKSCDAIAGPKFHGIYFCA